MEDYAIVQINHHQYIVEPNKTYTVEKFEAEQGKKVNLDVLARGKAENFEVGSPMLDKVKVEVEIIEQDKKGKKVTTRDYKAKSRYRRTHGFRPRLTTFKVLSIK